MDSFSPRMRFEATHPEALAVYCSDGRFTDAVEELLHHLGYTRLDTLTLPGGADCRIHLRRTGRDVRGHSFLSKATGPAKSCSSRTSRADITGTISMSLPAMPAGSYRHDRSSGFEAHDVAHYYKRTGDSLNANRRLESSGKKREESRSRSNQAVRAVASPWRALSTREPELARGECWTRIIKYTLK